MLMSEQNDSIPTDAQPLNIDFDYSSRRQMEVPQVMVWHEGEEVHFFEDGVEAALGRIDDRSMDSPFLARVVGVLAARSMDETVTKQMLVEETASSPNAVLRHVRTLMLSGLIFEGPMAPSDSHNPRSLTLVKSRELDEAVTRVPLWHRAKQIREVMRKTGMSEEEVIGFCYYALPADVRKPYGITRDSLVEKRKTA